MRGREKMAELWRRLLRLEEARTWKLAFMWAASTADHLADETARAAEELEQLQGAGRVAGASLPGAEERYRQLVLKLEEMQAIERALERQVLRGRRWRKVWGAVRRAVRRAVGGLLKKIRGLERWILRIATRRGRAERSRQDETVYFCGGADGMRGLW